MKVRVEMEMPCSCRECSFFHSGTVFDWCKFPPPNGMDTYGPIKENRDKRQEWCPLNDCVRVVECKVTHHHTTTIEKKE